MALLQAPLNKKVEADKIIKRHIAYAAGAGAIPLVLVDTLTIAGVQFAMIKKIAQLYEVDFEKQKTKSITAALLGSFGTTISAFKFFPGIGLIMGTIKTSALGAAYTYTLGKVFAQHFDQGGTLLDFDAASVKEFFNESVAQEKKKFLPAQNKAKKNIEKISVQQLLLDTEKQYADLEKIQEVLMELISSEKIERI